MQSLTQLLANLDTVHKLHTIAMSVATFGEPSQAQRARQLIQDFGDISLDLVTEVTNLLVQESTPAS